MKKFAVFDIDGTLIRWQLYHAVVNQLAKDGLLGKDAYSQIKKARMGWKQREGVDSFRNYERVLIQAFDNAITALEPKEFERAIASVINEYKDQVYVYTYEKLIELKKKDYFLLAISGSVNEVVDKLARHFGFDDWVGSIYGQKDGVFTGAKKIIAHDKESELKLLVKKHGLTYKDSWGFGDSKSDGPILGMVDNPVAFNPDMHLLKTAKDNSWDIVIERKNVIYKLEARDGTYILA